MPQHCWTVFQYYPDRNETFALFAIFKALLTSSTTFIDLGIKTIDFGQLAGIVTRLMACWLFVPTARVKIQVRLNSCSPEQMQTLWTGRALFCFIYSNNAFLKLKKMQRILETISRSGSSWETELTFHVPDLDSVANQVKFVWSPLVIYTLLLCHALVDFQGLLNFSY